jgi:hypothetical protein
MSQENGYKPSKHSWGVKIDAKGNYTVNEWSSSGQLLLGIDKNSFGFNEDIQIYFLIKNRGNRIISIFPSEVPLRSFKLVIKDEKNKSVPLKSNISDGGPYYKGRFLQAEKLNSYQREENRREIVLYPGESYKKRLNIRDFFEIQGGKSYFIKGYFYPDINRNPLVFSSSGNVLKFYLDYERGHFTAAVSDPVAEYEEVSAIPYISPEETIYLFLTAEFKRNWSAYLKFIDFEEFIRAFDNYAQEYIKASYQDRPIVLSRFKKFLTREQIYPLKRFKILGTKEILKGRLVNVTVDIERDKNRFPLKYIYEYQLEKHPGHGFWKITYLTVKLKQK